MREGGVGFAAEHAGEFFDSGAAFDSFKARNGAVPGEFLGDDELRVGQCGDLRKMADAEDLMMLPERTHFRTDGVRDFSAHIGVDFVEDEQRDRVLRRER